MTEVQKPTTPKARETYDKLLESAENIFAEQGFFRSSVVEICNKAGVSNGTFYRYFSDKNDIFVELADRLGTNLAKRIQQRFLNSKKGFDLRLRYLLTDYFSYLRHNSSLYRIFRQAEFVNRNTHEAFYKKLTNTLARGLARGKKSGYFRDHDPRVVAHYLLGTLSFVSMRWIIWESTAVGEKVTENLLDFLKQGIEINGATTNLDRSRFSPMEHGYKKNQSIFLQENDTNETKPKLLAAAESSFGGKGFYGTTIGDITREAQVAQGTFYHHFSSKLEIFETLVQEMNELWRHEAKIRTRKLSDRREVELEGFRVFFNLISKHSDMYRIVREAEFVDKSLGRWYYESFADGYQNTLASAMSGGEILKMHPEVLAYSLMGIGHFLGQKWFVQEEREKFPPSEFEAMFDLIFRGIKS